MKNKVFKYILFSIFSAIFAICSTTLFSTKESKAFAEEFPNYLVTEICQYKTGYNEDEGQTFNQFYTKKSVGGDIEQNGVYLVASGEAVLVSLTTKNAENTSVTIDDIMYTVTINGKAYVPSENYAMELNYRSNIFELLVKHNAYTVFGEYQINLIYIETSNGISTSKQITSAFTILNKADYLTNDVTANTTLNKNYTTTNGIYARTAYYNYSTQSVIGGLVLPTITYNKERFSIVLTKNVSGGLSYSQTITYDGYKIVTSGDTVLSEQDIVEMPNSGLVKLVFNDAGSYIVEYSYLFTNRNEDNSLNFIRNITIANYSAKADKIDVFGYQINYSNFETGKYSEMKIRTQENIESQYAVDFSYLFSSTTTGDIEAKEPNELATILAALKAELNKNHATIQKTNQPLINFTTSRAKLCEEYSRIFTITGKGTDDYSLKDGKVFDNTPIGDAGKYFVKIVYTYSDYNDSSLGVVIKGTRYFVQYFAFEITEDMPDFSVKAINRDENGEEIEPSILANDSFTNKDVRIKKRSGYDSVYYAKTQISISKQTNFSGAYEQIYNEIPQEGVVVTDSARYKVVLNFGRNNEKGFTTYFTIDKESVNNFAIETVVASGDKTYIRDGVVDFFTNQSVALSWQNKQSGARVYASYKLVPMQKTYYQYTSDELKRYYDNDGSVPTSYQFAYSNGQTLPVVDCFNSQANTYISSEKILSASGLYIVKIYDEAGNETYVSFMIDNSPTQILEMVNKEYIVSDGVNIISDTFEINIGKNKIIEFNNFQDYRESEGNWFTKLGENYEQYFKAIYSPAIKYFVSVPIDQHILFSVDETAYSIEDISVNSYELNGFITVGENAIDVNFVNQNLQVEEHQYSFYVQDSSSTKTLFGYDKYSYENFKVNYSGIKQVKTTSDASRVELTYKTISGDTKELNQVATEEVGQTKKTYYSPKAAAKINSANRSIYLKFLANPSENLKVSKVTYKFAQFKKVTDAKNEQKELPALTFDILSEEFVVYDKNDANQTRATYNEDGSYSWIVNEYYNSKTNKMETKPGKYVITRTYDISESGAESAISNKLDFIVREFVFIVDDNDIVSYPEEFEDDNGDTILVSTVGGANRIQIGSKFFDNIYIRKNTSENSPILVTNMLPVIVKIPVYKYGYLNGNDFSPSENINIYKLSSGEVKIYELSAKISYSENPDLLDASKEVYVSHVDGSSNWLSFGDNLQFKKKGYYKVTIMQGEDEFNFVFQITYKKPTFEVTKTNNSEISSISDVYYTNEEEVRVSWADDASEYMAKIDKTKIYYSINGGTKVQVPTASIETIDLNNYFILNLKEIGAYQNGSSIEVFMQYEGTESDYSSAENYRTSKTIVVDIEAPKENLVKLLSLSGLDAGKVREISDRQNITITSGVYQNFAFGLDVDLLQQTIAYDQASLFETTEIYYKDITDNATKYKYQETDINALRSSISHRRYIYSEVSLDDLVNKYYEFVEVDRAGNITVYSVYFYRKSAYDDRTAIEYSYNKNKEDTNYIKTNQLNRTMYLYSKNAFNIKQLEFFGYPYLEIEIAGNVYVRTPYTYGLFYKLADEKQYNLDVLSVLLANDNIYKLSLNNVPSFGKIALNVSVTDNNLDVLSLNQTGQFYNQEGVLIKIPTSTEENVLKIFADQLKIETIIAGARIALFDSESIAIENFKECFKQVLTQDFSTEQVSIGYVVYNGASYIKFNVKNPIRNNHYIYEIEDNFNEKTKITHIYGETVIDREMSSDVAIIEAYNEKGYYSYYSTEDIIYKFNTAKYSAKLYVTAGESTSSYDIATNTDKEYYQVYIDSRTSICTLVLKKAKLNLANGEYGNCLDFKLELRSKIEDDEIEKTLYFEIYNQVPMISLWGVNGESQNDLFNRGRMYGSSLYITYNQINSKYDYIVALGTTDENKVNINSNYRVSEKGTYYIYVCYLGLFEGEEYNQKFEFTISDTEESFYNVVVHTDNGDVVKTPISGVFKSADGYIVNTHYFVNSTEFEIYTNAYLNIKATEKEIITSATGYRTYIYLITNAGSTDVSTSKYFTREIAITVIPESTKILSKFAHYVSGGSSESLEDSTEATFVAEKNEANKRLVWQPYYGVEENKVMVKVYYDKIDESSVYTPKITTNASGLSVMELTTSGTYYLRFYDLAGNVNYFDDYGSNEYFTITYLKSVIFKVQGETPINFATYNDDVVVSIDAYTLKYYNSDSRPSITVLKNGVEYKPQRDSTGLIYTFTEPGLYKVWFSAKLTEKGETEPKSINEEPIYFTIQKKNEANTYYTITKYNDYYIERIEKVKYINGEEVYQDVTADYTNVNMGELVTISSLNENGETITKKFLKNLTLSYDDYFTGAGRYKLYIKTNNEFNQSFAYEVYINKNEVPLNLSIENRGQTTDEIKVTFNSQNMIDALGDCIIKITGRKDIVLTRESLEAGDLQSVYEIALSEDRTYTIEVRTIGDVLIESYVVTKNAPLNTVTIVLIIVASVTVVALAVTFILLRKRMKIR